MYMYVSTKQAFWFVMIDTFLPIQSMIDRLIVGAEVDDKCRYHQVKELKLIWSKS